MCRRGVLRLGLHTSQRQLNPLAPDDQKSENARAAKKRLFLSAAKAVTATGERRLAARAELKRGVHQVSASRDAARATRRARRDARSIARRGGG